MVKFCLADRWKLIARLSLVISRDLSENLPQADWFVNGGALPKFTSSFTWLVPVNKPKLPHPHVDKGGVKEQRALLPMTWRELLTTRRCFTLREVRLKGFLGI
jgi:hypothetical protein